VLLRVYFGVPIEALNRVVQLSGSEVRVAPVMRVEVWRRGGRGCPGCQRRGCV